MMSPHGSQAGLPERKTDPNTENMLIGRPAPQSLRDARSQCPDPFKTGTTRGYPKPGGMAHGHVWGGLLDI